MSTTNNLYNENTIHTKATTYQKNTAITQYKSMNQFPAVVLLMNTRNLIWLKTQHQKKWKPLHRAGCTNVQKDSLH